MAGSDTAPEATEWRRTSKFYRQPPGLAWLIGLLVIPLLLGVIGYGELGRTLSDVTGPTGALPTLNVPTPPGGAPKTPSTSSMTYTSTPDITSLDFSHATTLFKGSGIDP
jgi:peptidoglycan-binding protein ArfA